MSSSRCCSGSETLQVVLSPHASPLPWTSHDTKEDRSIPEWFEVEEGPRIAEEINDDFTTLLFRLNLYHSPHSSYLSVSIHHALYDGLAFPLLMKEVDAAYRAQTLQDAVPLARVVHPTNRSLVVILRKSFGFLNLRRSAFTTDNSVRGMSALLCDTPGFWIHPYRICDRDVQRFMLHSRLCSPALSLTWEGGSSGGLAMRSLA